MKISLKKTEGLLKSQGDTVSVLNGKLREMSEKQRAFIDATNQHLADHQKKIDQSLEDREKALQDSLTLLNEHSKNSLETIEKKATELAGINRTTFYNHYGSQYDVLAEIRDWYLRDIADAIESAELRDRDSMLIRVTLVFEYIQQNLEISRLLIQNNIDETFAQRLFSLPKIEGLLTETMQSNPNHEYDRDVISFAIYGGYKLVQDWISADNRRSAPEMAQLVLHLCGVQ